MGIEVSNGTVELALNLDVVVLVLLSKNDKARTGKGTGGGRSGTSEKGPGDVQGSKPFEAICPVSELFADSGGCCALPMGSAKHGNIGVLR